MPYIWEDREVKFDIPDVQKKLRNGEKILDIIDLIEDTKGNVGDSGRLLITNLRIIWYSLKTSKFSLSIGLLTILTLNTKSVLSKIRGTTQALFLLTNSLNSRYEFIFTNLSTVNDKEFKSIYEIYRIYQSTLLYRELKLRGAIIISGQLNILPNEQIYNTINGVWNLSSDQGNLGTFFVTNIRLVWFADMNDTFNISLPYMQMQNIRIRNSKYGPALVINTMETAGGYVLGFRIDPNERLDDVFKELNSLYAIYSESPIFGVDYKLNNSNLQNLNEKLIKADDIEEIDNRNSNEINNTFSTYLADGIQNKTREPFYCKDLGLAMEKIKDGYTLKDLWEVINAT